MTEPGTRRVAWVTGAGKGIGRAVAKRLASEGWIVAASARTADDLCSLVVECAPGMVRALPLDVTDAARTKTVVDLIEREIGELTLAVLNAGTHIPVNADGFDIATFRKLLDVNVMGTVNCLSELLPRFLARGQGQVAVVASLAGYRGLPSSAAYGASKAALINMCEALRPELESRGVGMTLVNPGFVETPLTDRNDFPMPFLITAEEAAQRIVRGLKRGKFEIAFPWRFAFLMKVLRLLPHSLFFGITRRMVRQ